MTDYVHHKVTIGDLTVEIVPDDDPVNPLSWDSPLDRGLAMLCWHRRFHVGDVHGDFGLPEADDLRERFPGGWPEIQTYLETEEAAAAVLPVYMIDHGRRSLSTTPFGDRFDSGQIGFIFTVGTVAFADAEAAMRGFVSAVDDYINGRAYGFVIRNQQGDVVDSQWGFTGDYETSGVIEEGVSLAKHIAAHESAEARRCAEMMAL